MDFQVYIDLYERLICDNLNNKYERHGLKLKNFKINP